MELLITSPGASSLFPGDIGVGDTACSPSGDPLILVPRISCTLWKKEKQ